MNAKLSNRAGAQELRIEVKQGMDSEAMSVEIIRRPLAGMVGQVSPLGARQAGPKAGRHRCPHCDSIIYSRRNKLCGLCGRELPSTVLFDAQEAARVEDLLESERHRHKQWRRRLFLEALSIC